MVRLILGSQSPRRKEILSHFALPFEQATPSFNEEIHPYKGNPSSYVCELSDGKALSLAHNFPDAVILTADTIVWMDEKIYGKPKNQQEAFQILSTLQGKWHSVFSGVTVLFKDKLYHDFEETRVLFNPLSEEQIRKYHEKLHWADKAGAYAIQMGGGLVVRQIEGCYYNVMGLPINTLRALLLKVGIDLWAYLK